MGTIYLRSQWWIYEREKTQKRSYELSTIGQACLPDFLEKVNKFKQKTVTYSIFLPTWTFIILVKVKAYLTFLIAWLVTDKWAALSLNREIKYLINPKPYLVQYWVLKYPYRDKIPFLTWTIGLTTSIIKCKLYQLSFFILSPDLIKTSRSWLFYLGKKYNQQISVYKIRRRLKEFYDGHNTQPAW